MNNPTHINYFYWGAHLSALTLFVALSLEWLGGSLLGLGLLGAFFYHQKIKIDIIGQLIFFLLSLGLGYVLTITLGVSGQQRPPGDIGPWSVFFATGFLVYATFRLFLTKPQGGNLATNGFLLFALLAMGGVSKGIFFPILSVTTLFLLILSLNPAATILGRKMTPKRSLGFAASILISVAVFFTLSITLPLAYKYAFKVFQSSYYAPRSGFSTFFELGNMKTMLLSDKKVMRVFGNKPDYLRGKVYTRYRHGTWLNTHEHKLEEHDYSAPPTPTKTRSNSKPNTEIQFIGSVRDRYFLPMDAATIGTENGGGRTDLGGIIHTLPDERTERIWFTQSTKSDIKIASPIEDELKISKSIQASITDLSNRWTHGLKTKQEKLIAIEKKLKTDFSYALAFTYNGHLDPIMGFLLEVKAGHCEYFATAMALLARAQGIPTHVVGGYRVRQLSSMGNYYLVRERNAHSWVEAWLPNQGWVRYDPTPTTEVPLPEKESFSMAALGDYLIVLINTGLDHLTQLSFTQLAILVGVMACIWALIIIIRQVKAKRSKKLISSPQNFREGLASLEQLMAQTALFGLKKQPNEPLEVFAQRLINTSNTQLNFKKAGTIVNKYTEWRYGTHGEAAAIDDEINRWLTAQKGRQDKKKF